MTKHDKKITANCSLHDPHLTSSLRVTYKNFVTAMKGVYTLGENVVYAFSTVSTVHKCQRNRRTELPWHMPRIATVLRYKKRLNNRSFWSFSDHMQSRNQYTSSTRYKGLRDIYRRGADESATTHWKHSLVWLIANGFLKCTCLNCTCCLFSGCFTADRQYSLQFQ